MTILFSDELKKEIGQLAGICTSSSNHALQINRLYYEMRKNISNALDGAMTLGSTNGLYTVWRFRYNSDKIDRVLVANKVIETIAESSFCLLGLLKEVDVKFVQESSFKDGSVITIEIRMKFDSKYIVIDSNNENVFTTVKTDSNSNKVKFSIK